MTPSIVSLMLIGACTLRSIATSAYAQRPKSQEWTAESWMSDWMLGRKTTSRIVASFADPVYFTLVPIRWRPPQDQDGLPMIDVPIGFVTNLLDIPQAFWSLLRPSEEYALLAILHSYMYWMQSLSRETTDERFDLAMDDFRVEIGRRIQISRAIRVVGEESWKMNMALKASGERRILRYWPDNPRITWIEWKKDNTVFRDN